jgi:hypothetical protein
MGRPRRPADLTQGDTPHPCPARVSRVLGHRRTEIVRAAALASCSDSDEPDGNHDGPCLLACLPGRNSPTAAAVAIATAAIIPAMSLSMFAETNHPSAATVKPARKHSRDRNHSPEWSMGPLCPRVYFA